MNRLFHPDSGRCLAIAVDHGMPGEPDLLEGIEDMEAVIDALVAADPEALLLTPGQADLLQRRVGRAKPALVLRVDTGNVFGREVPERPASWMYDDPIGIAVRFDAACVIANLQDSPGQPSLRETLRAEHRPPARRVRPREHADDDRAGADGAQRRGLRRPPRRRAPARPRASGDGAGRRPHQVRPATRPGRLRPRRAHRPRARPGARRRAHPRRRGPAHHRRRPGGGRRRPRLRAQCHPARRPVGDDPRARGPGARARDGRRRLALLP